MAFLSVDFTVTYQICANGFFFPPPDVLCGLCSLVHRHQRLG